MAVGLTVVVLSSDFVTLSPGGTGLIFRVTPFQSRDRVELSITIQHTKEQLCFAHLTAIAARAGVNLHFLGGANDYGVDGTFRSVTVDRDASGSRRRETGFGIDFQAKASISWLLRGNEILYDLERKAYNDLVRRSQAAATFIVILLCLPRTSGEWHEATPEQATMRNACYWLSLQGAPTENTARIRVRFPLTNLLTADSLSAILAQDQAVREAMFDE
jgi:hypothetical protein